MDNSSLKELLRSKEENRILTSKITGIENEELLKNFNNGLYLKMQDELNINKKRIKWNIEKSIDYMYLNTNTNFLANYFSLEFNQKITPKLFISTIVENFYTY